MGKSKSLKKQSSTSESRHDTKSRGRAIQKRQYSQTSAVSSHAKQKANGKSGTSTSLQAKPKIPFSRYDRVLLVGEGDFSFALSLVHNHAVASVVATSYDDEATLKQKYPAIEAALQALQDSKRVKLANDQEEVEDEWYGFSANEAEDDHGADRANTGLHIPSIVVLHGIDATMLSKVHRKTLSRHAPFTKIVFNFPHVGGLSTDVNRQVRANQELLVGFLNSATPLLATAANPAKHMMNDTNEGDEEYEEDSKNDRDEQAMTLRSGRILVTLFEGEPYSLWNIRDLARHCGLQVIESFRFPWAAYPSYKHARTIGDITSGKDKSDEGKRKGAWRGEEREARCYVLCLKEEAVKRSVSTKKRKRGKESDDSE